MVKQSLFAPAPPPKDPNDIVSQNLANIAPLLQAYQGAQSGGVQQPAIDPRSVLAGFQTVPSVGAPPQPTQNAFTADTSGMSAAQERLKRIAKQAQDAAEAAPKFPDFIKFGKDGQVESTQAQSPFEQGLAGKMQQEIIKGFSGTDSVGDRFSKGSAIGQQLAASLVVPLLGLFGKGAGTAAGANAASAQLLQNVAYERAQQRQEKASKNESLARLASLYETMSPQSSKNITDRIKLQLDSIKNQHELAARLNEISINATKAEQGGAEGIAKLNQAGAADLFKAKVGSYGQDLDRARLVDSQNNSVVNLQNMLGEQGYKQFQALMSAHNANTADDKLKLEKQTASDNKDLKNQAQAEQALHALEQQTRLHAQNIMGKNALNQPKIPGYADYVKNDPSIEAEFEKQARLAGLPASVTGASIKAALLAQTQAPQAGGDDFNLGALLSNAAKGAIGGAQGLASNVLGYSKGAASQKMGTSNGYAGVKGFKGLVEPGNIDLSRRPIVDNQDGSYGTEYSMSFDDGKNEVVIPTIYDGAHHTEKEAIQHYRETGEHMGKFASGDYKRADQYAEKIHQRVTNVDGKPYNGAPAPKDALIEEAQKRKGLKQVNGVWQVAK